VRRRLRRVEQRVAGPHVIDIVDPQVRMLEQVRRLAIDLERVLLIEQARVEPLIVAELSVLQTTTRASVPP
jgi:hypothetical protein